MFGPKGSRRKGRTRSVMRCFLLQSDLGITNRYITNRSVGPKDFPECTASFRTNGMDSEEKLSEVPEEHIPLLLEDLKSDFPTSVHAWNFLVTIRKWKAFEPTLKAKILAVNGDFRSKMIVYYTLSSDLMHFRGSIHKWSHREDDTHILTEVLKNTKKVPWNTEMFLLTAMTPETDKAVIPALDEIWKGKTWHCSSGHHVYWVPKEEAINWSVDVPEGAELSFLDEHHANEINNVWPHRDDSSEKHIALMMKVNFGLGLLDSHTHELLSWAIHWFFGGLGAWQTKENHKKKGYGRVILEATTKEIAKRGYDVHLNILPNNTASISLVQKTPYRFAFHATWIEKSKASC